MASIFEFVARGVFDDATLRTMDRAFDAVRKELGDQGQPEIVQEVIAQRIVGAAHKGERDLMRLRDFALAGVPKAEPRKVGGSYNQTSPEGLALPKWRPKAQALIL